MPPRRSNWPRNLQPLEQTERRLKGRLDELVTLYDFPKAVRSNRQTEKTLRLMARKIASSMGALICTIRFLNARGNVLQLKAAYGLRGHESTSTREISLDGSALGRMAKRGRPLLSNRLARRGGFPEFVTRRKIRAALLVPVIAEKTVVGILAVYTRSRRFNREDVQILGNFADQVAILLEGTRLHAKAREGYLKTIQMLVNVIDIKDNYTRGHSERVMKWCEKIADAMGLSPKRKELAMYGGLLHDLGKIGIDVKILRKPAPLTPREWVEIRKHPKIGADIVRRSKILSDLAPIILRDHERYGGGGYPNAKMKGEQIPLESRIVSVADAYEVITSDRPYRKARSKGEAIAELKRCSGTQFDPKVVRALLRILKRKPRLR